MIRKRVSMLVLGIFFLMGACNSVSEGNQTESDNDTPGTIDPGNETKKPVMDQDPVTIEQTHEEILEEVKAAIVTDVDVKLPEDVLTSDGFLTAATSSSTDSYEVNFYVTNVPVAVNDPSLEDAHPYMIVYGTKFDSEDGAKAKINYQPVQDGKKWIWDMALQAIWMPVREASFSHGMWAIGRFPLVIITLKKEAKI